MFAVRGTWLRAGTRRLAAERRGAALDRTGRASRKRLAAVGGAPSLLGVAAGDAAGSVVAAGVLGALFAGSK